MTSLTLRHGLPRLHRSLQRLIATTATTRDVRFQTVTEQHVHYFQNLLGEPSVITDPSDIQPYNVDWMRRFIGTSKLALKPRTTAEVSAILSYCNTHRLAVVPQGGNTGMVGGSVPVFDEIVLSLSAMSEIESFDESSGVVVAQAGVVLETLDTHVRTAGHRVPLDLGAKGSCQIGGNVATNAGGSRFIRYGSLRASVLGIEAVLPDGRVLDALSTLRKDNTGYDVKQLMIGSEGTLGVITKVALACPVATASSNAVMLRVDDFNRVLPLLQIARERLAEILSAFEYMDDEVVNMATSHLTHVVNPLPLENDDEGNENNDGASTANRGGGLILIESAGSNAEHDREKLDGFLEAAFEADVISNGVIAESETQASAMWELRESLSEAVLKAGTGGTLKYDVSLPLSAFHTCIAQTRERVRDIAGVKVTGWGHVGDGNLHLNISVADAAAHARVAACMEPWLYEMVQGWRGSVSAEHGLGVMKAAAIGYTKGDVAVSLMRDVKRVVDPNGICNPYKVLPAASVSKTID